MNEDGGNEMLLIQDGMMGQFILSQDFDNSLRSQRNTVENESFQPTGFQISSRGKSGTAVSPLGSSANNQAQNFNQGLGVGSPRDK